MKAIQTGNEAVRFQEILRELSQRKVSELEQFMKELLNIIEHKKSPKETQSEEELIHKIKNGGPSEAFWAEFDVYAMKLEEKTMTEEERADFKKLLLVTQRWAAERLKLIIELAKRQQITVDEVLVNLNIKPR